MPAEVETLAYRRETPWHGIGERVEDLMTAEEAIERAHLDWEVLKVPSYGCVPAGPSAALSEDVAGAGLEVPNGLLLPDEGRFKTYRSSDGAFLGDVGDPYEVLQNREAFAFADSLVDSGDAKYDTAGALRGGKVVFLAMKFPREILIGGVDPIELYGVLWNSHDGSKAITMMATPIRPVCMNTLQLGLRRAVSTWSVKHLGTLDGRLQEARESLRLTFDYADEFAEEMDRLAQQPFTDAQFEQLVERVTGPATRLGERWAEGLLQSWEGGPERGTHNRESRYDALNAVTEYGDWLRGPRTDMSRVEATLFGSAMRARKRAYKLLSQDALDGMAVAA